MAFNVTFYSFSKKKNSTARPTGSGTTYGCRIKAPSGIIHPIIEISSLSDTIPTFNYAYIPAFDDRYYYVREWTQEPGNIWSAQLDIDALASWKTVIGAQSFYVLRSSAAHDGLIKDTMYPTKADYDYQILAGDSGQPWWQVGAGPVITGRYVVGLLSYNTTADTFGGVNYISMTPDQMRGFLARIFDTSEPQSYMGKTSDSLIPMFRVEFPQITDEQIANLAYIMENPFTDYIKSITWVPGSNGEAILPNILYLGPNRLTGFVFYGVDVSNPYIFLDSFTVPQHPKAASRGKYLNTEPFTEYYLKLPRLGFVSIPSDLIANREVIRIRLAVDPITGEGMYSLYVSDPDHPGNPIEVQRWFAQVGVQVEIAQTKDVGTRAQALMNIAGLALDTLSGNPGSLTQLPAAIGDIVKSRNASGQTIGQNGGWLGLEGDNGRPRLIAIFHDVVDDDNAQNGRPLCKVRTPASLGGYMMIQDADISIYGTEEEHDIIKETMESGFYYE